MEKYMTMTEVYDIIKEHEYVKVKVNVEVYYNYNDKTVIDITLTSDDLELDELNEVYATVELEKRDIKIDKYINDFKEVAETLSNDLSNYHDNIELNYNGN